MKPERPIFEEPDPAVDAAADKRALDDIEAGRLIDHREVAAWLGKWGTPEEQPAPRKWRD